jgi:SAM-dependent methyltransferase
MRGNGTFWGLSRTFLPFALSVSAMWVAPWRAAATPEKAVSLAESSAAGVPAAALAGYATGEATPGGTGRYYFGREIASFMSHLGAPWLERPEREREERPDQLLEALALRPGDVVADIGCGTGYHARRFAAAVGPTGRVYGVEIQPEMLALFEGEMKRRGISQAQGVLGTPEDPRLPEPVDVAILIDVNHECSHPAEMIAAICRRLKPGGRLVLVEFRGEDPRVPIRPLHKMTEAQIRREMAVHPLEHVETVRTLPWQHLVVFRHRES